MEATNFGRNPSGIAAAPLLVLLALGLAGRAWAQDKACSLVTPAELEAALGTKAPALKPQAVPGGNASICMGQTATATVMLRMAKRANPGGDTEAKGIEMAKKMGAKVEVKSFGQVTCSTMVPPPSLAQYGYNTTCSVLKNGTVVAIEVTAKAQQDMVAMEKLRPVAEKMASRI